jgi:hypothetical protein
MGMKITKQIIGSVLHCIGPAILALRLPLTTSQACSQTWKRKINKASPPLHLAVKSVEVLKSTRPVRALLLKGSLRADVDNSGRTPTDMISPNLATNLRLELISMLVR